MKRYFSKKLFLSIIVVLAILFMHKNVYAVGGQASGPSSLRFKNVSYFFELIRAMETSTGTLGKNSNINTDTYVDNSGNGIDCHLEKNTEYGTITLLAASEYGNATSTDSASTGLGSTGVFQMSNGYSEYVANTYSSEKDGTPTTNDYNGALTRADSRYVNKYYGSKHSITGDGLIETDGAGGDTWFLDADYPVFYRGVIGLYGYNRLTGEPSYGLSARAVVMCGSGL